MWGCYFIWYFFCHQNFEQNFISVLYYLQFYQLYNINIIALGFILFILCCCCECRWLVCCLLQALEELTALVSYSCLNFALLLSVIFRRLGTNYHNKAFFLVLHHPSSFCFSSHALVPSGPRGRKARSCYVRLSLHQQGTLCYQSLLRCV